MCLEGLEPHPNLKKLFISGYGGVRFPIWLSSISNLVEFSLKKCKKCQHMPPLDQLPSLKILYLDRLDALEYLPLSKESSGSSEELSVSSFFPSLKKLTLANCPNLKGWRRNRDSVQERHLLLLPSFPRLSYLSISYCPKLTSMPLFPLYLNNASIKALQQIMIAENPTSTTTITSASSTSSSSSTIVTSSSPPLCNLKCLTLIDDFESLREDWMRNLATLEELKNFCCPRLRYVSQGIQYLTALKNLDISHCDEFELSNDGDGDGMQWKGLRSLHSLKFRGLPKLASLPVGLQHVTTLQNMWIQCCGSLIAIPGWISNLTSLQKLLIMGCPNLRSLPQGMRALTSLWSLEISGCPVLSQRCKRKTGEDWPKISHIEYLNVDSTKFEEDPEPGHKTWSLMKTLGCCNCSTNQW